MKGDVLKVLRSWAVIKILDPRKYEMLIKYFLTQQK